VWLIEVNTCPYLGAVLPSEQPSFMLDLMDDTLKLTADRLFFPDSATTEQLEASTQYELLWSADGKVNKRTELKRDQEPAKAPADQDPTKPGKEDVKTHQQPTG
jgi:hypothetical protein